MNLISKKTFCIFFITALINFAHAADDCVETKSILNKFRDYLSSIFIKPAPLPVNEAEAFTKMAKSKITKSLGLKESDLGETFIGSMNISVMTKGEAVFPNTKFMPEKLRGQPIKDKIIKVVKDGTSVDRISRDEIALDELSSVLNPKSKVKLCETHIVNLPDGTKMIVQEKAKGRHVRDIFKDLFSDVFDHVPDEYELDNLITTFSSKEGNPCLGLEKTKMHINIICGSLLDSGVDLDKLAAKMSSPKIRNIRETLHELREISEGKLLPRTSENNIKIALGNKLFYNERISPIFGLDMSVENFKLDIVGDTATAYVFDW